MQTSRSIEAGRPSAPEGLFLDLVDYPEREGDEAGVIFGGKGTTPPQMQEIASLAVEKFDGWIEQVYIYKTPEWANVKEMIVAWSRTRPEGTTMTFGEITPSPWQKLCQAIGSIMGRGNG